jgi:hypothetical protein
MGATKPRCNTPPAGPAGYCGLLPTPPAARWCLQTPRATTPQPALEFALQGAGEQGATGEKKCTFVVAIPHNQTTTRLTVKCFQVSVQLMLEKHQAASCSCLIVAAIPVPRCSVAHTWRCGMHCGLWSYRGYDYMADACESHYFLGFVHQNYQAVPTSPKALPAPLARQWTL